MPKQEEVLRKNASRGGTARAIKLSADERSAIAQRAAEARWGSMAEAPFTGKIKIGDRIIDCAVLDDGTRLINQTTMQDALERRGGARRGPGARGLPVLSALNLQRFISDELRDLAENPIRYRLASSGARAVGYRAEILPMVCEVYLEARSQEGALTKNQRPVAAAAEVLLRGLARTGIVALVDEATGYQDERARHELQLILERYVQAEFRPWIKTFPDDFFREIYRIMGWEYRPGSSKRAPYVGKLVNKYVYDQLPPGVAEELPRVNPRTDKGHRRYKHHKFLTADTGSPHLDKQITTVTTLLRVSEDRAQFEQLFERAFPPTQDRLPLVVPDSDDN